MKQNRLGLRKLSPAGEGGEGVAVAEEQPQEIVFVPVSLSDMLTMFFQADRTLNEAAIPNVTRALQFGVSNEKANTSRSITLMCSAKGWSLTTMATHSVSTFSFRPSKGDLSHKLQVVSDASQSGFDIERMIVSSLHKGRAVQWQAGFLCQEDSDGDLWER